MTTQKTIANTQSKSVTTPADLLNIAVSQNADLNKLEKLMDLQERWEANEARKAYATAMALFKTETIEILKNKKVQYENQDKSITTYYHPSLDHVVEVAAPLLAKHGLSHKWSTSQGEGGRITVTCVLTHELGHRESESLSASPDDSGRKNNIQRVASTVTYLERYTFLAITGLAAKGQDDDGVGAGDREIGQKERMECEMRGIEYGMACYRHKEVIEEVKDRLADNDLIAAATTLYQLTNKELQSIWRAPTKGGIFTIEERKLMSKDSEEWQEAIQIGIKNNPEIDRSM
jgi:hypothetical protein